MKHYLTSIIIAFCISGMIIPPIHADTIPVNIEETVLLPDHTQIVRTEMKNIFSSEADIEDAIQHMSAEDLAFLAEHPDTIKLAAGLTMDEFLYGGILLASVLAIVIYLRARRTKHLS